MGSKQDDTRLFEWNPALNGNLPEVLVQYQHDAGLGLGKIQQDGILPSGAIGPGPAHIVAGGAESLDDRLGKVLVGEQAHLSWKRVGLVFVGQVTGIRQTGENVVSRQAGIVGITTVYPTFP